MPLEWNSKKKYSNQEYNISYQSFEIRYGYFKDGERCYKEATKMES